MKNFYRLSKYAIGFNLIIILFAATACQQTSDSNPKSQSVSSGETASDKTVNSVSSGDSKRGHKLVSNCAACHGEYGARSRNGAPFVSGQKSEYLYSALSAYQDGRRKHEQMREYVKSLTAQDLMDLSVYFEQQNKREWKPESKQMHTKARSISRGRVASTPCVDCHGLDGNSHIAEVPSLAGISPDYFISAFDNYFSERRKGTIMKHFKHAVSWEELHDLAEYFSSLPRLKSTIKVPGNPKRGEKLAIPCAKCHGQYGETIVSSMPDLARQNPLYLVGAIRAYQSGKRQNALMKAEVMDLKDQAIKDIASFYALITAPETAQQEKEMQSASTDFDPIRDGKILAENCVPCHGKQGNSQSPGVPSLSALSPKYFVQALLEYKNGKRHHQMMQSFAEAIDRGQMDKLAYYFYAQPRQTRMLQTPPVKPEVSLLATCNGCHGDFGQGDKPTVPEIASQDPDYLQSALLSYRSGRRTQMDMQENTKDLSDETIKQLAAFYAAQLPPKVVSQKFSSPQELASKCGRCHGSDGMGMGDKVPRIAGQSKNYLLSALLAYKNSDRVQSTMYAMVDILTLTEMEGIANYYSTLKPSAAAATTTPKAPN